MEQHLVQECNKYLFNESVNGSFLLGRQTKAQGRKMTYSGLYSGDLDTAIGLFKSQLAAQSQSLAPESLVFVGGLLLSGTVSGSRTLCRAQRTQCTEKGKQGSCRAAFGPADGARRINK